MRFVWCDFCRSAFCPMTRPSTLVDFLLKCLAHVTFDVKCSCCLLVVQVENAGHCLAGVQFQSPNAEVMAFVLLGLWIACFLGHQSSCLLSSKCNAIRVHILLGDCSWQIGCIYVEEEGYENWAPGHSVFEKTSFRFCWPNEGVESAIRYKLHDELYHVLAWNHVE